MSHTVDGDEVHFQLSGGQIVVIPLDELVESLKNDARRKKYKLNDLPEMTDTVGPIGGFRMRYTFERQDISPETAMQSGVSGSYARLKRWTLIPVSNQLGESVDAALAEGSEFRRALALHSRTHDDHHLDLPGQLRRIPPAQEGAVPTGLCHRRPAAARWVADQRFARRTEVGGGVGWAGRVSDD